MTDYFTAEQVYQSLKEEAAARLEIESLRAAQPAAAPQPGTAYAELPDAPLPVFSKGPWTFKETGQNFSGAELDEAAFVAYRDRASHGQPYPTIDDLCARIKAADDAAADRDYMLDSNDCIAVLRGEWMAPLTMDKPERASHGQAPAGATEEVENLRKALVYAAFALHDTPQYMLAQGITLIDGDTVRVSRDGWTVEASVNPHRQPAPATQQEAQEPHGWLYDWVSDEDEVVRDWFSTDYDEAHSPTMQAHNIRPLYTTPQPSPAAQGDALDAARYRWLCGKFGETRLPCALENMLEHVYIADGKPSIDAAIDAARAAQEGK
jgi:hypothetical protein